MQIETERHIEDDKWEITQSDDDFATALKAFNQRVQNHPDYSYRLVAVLVENCRKGSDL